MTGVENRNPSKRSREPGALSSARRSVQSRVNTRIALLTLGAAVTFFVIVGLVMYFKPGSTAAPKGEPSLDVFAAGPVLDFESGTMTLFENEHFFLVRHLDGSLNAFYDMGAHIQARFTAGDLEAPKCRAVIRKDEDMAGWLAAAGHPEGFDDRGMWDECDGVAWDASGKQVWGPQSGSLDKFPVEIIDGIMWIDLGNRACANPVTPETPCIVTQ